jgi:hypothetical protein
MTFILFGNNKKKKLAARIKRYIRRNLFSPYGWLLTASSGQSSWLQIKSSRVRFPALPDFLRRSGSGTGSTQPREDNLEGNWMEK